MLYTVLLIISVIIIYIWYKKQLKIYRFYDPNCHYCVESAPEWAKFKAANTTLNIIDVDIKQDPATAARFEITGVPNIIAVFPANKSKYSGDRSKEDLEKWVKSL